jgi:hypothetical protein
MKRLYITNEPKNLTKFTSNKTTNAPLTIISFPVASKSTEIETQKLSAPLRSPLRPLR